VSELVVVDSAEADDDLVRDITKILTSMCARPSGKRAAQNRAKRALEATEPRPAGGREARKRRRRKAAEQPRDGVQVA
jgi:hypothetical protein